MVQACSPERNRTTAKDWPRTLENAGTIDYTGTRFWFGPAEGTVGVIDNLVGAQFNVIGEGDLNRNYSASGPHFFNNAGTFTKSGEGTTEFGGVAFNNTGTTIVQSGNIGTDRRRAPAVVVLNANAGTTLEFGGSFETYELDASSSIASAGTVQFSGGTTTVDGSYAANRTTIAGGTAAFKHRLLWFYSDDERRYPNGCRHRHGDRQAGVGRAARWPGRARRS